VGLNHKIIEAVINGNVKAMTLAIELIGDIKIVDLTDEQVTNLSAIIRGEE
jgi:hypothetical protein